jgi:hypothetical protein
MLENFAAKAALALFVCGGCTHHMKVTPGFAPGALASQRAGGICPSGEAVSVTASNESPDGDSAGTTKAGIHTFEYRFSSDPSLALKLGLEDALRKGGCKVGGASSASLNVVIQSIEARGLACGFVSCEGSAEAVVEASLLDSAGKKVLTDTFTSSASAGCGMTICNEKEASGMASQILTETITHTVGVFAQAITKQLAAQHAQPASGPDSVPPAPAATEATAPPS